MEFRKIIPEKTSSKDLHQFMIGCVAPRPIAFVSSMDSNGNLNLAPYSYFNAISSNPPVVAFSVSKRSVAAGQKDTLRNASETGEVVINLVNHDILWQMALTSVEYEPGIDEFEKSGLTPIASDRVVPPRVLESPASLECKVRQILSLGDSPGAGQLVICDVLLIHIAENNIDDRNRINPQKMDLMGRMGRAYYVRAFGENIVPVVQPRQASCLGVDKLPESVRNSPYLRGSQLAMMAGVQRIPDSKEVRDWIENNHFRSEAAKINSQKYWHEQAGKLLNDNPKNRWEALMTAMIPDYI